MYMRSFAEQWPDFLSDEKVQQAVGQIPWGHNLVLISKLKKPEERLYYASKALEYGWSRDVLTLQIESGLAQREGKVTANFQTTLPSPQSDLARQTFKDPYVFDFLDLGEEIKERELESALIAHVSQFLLELGSGFAYVGNQVEVG